VSQMNEDEVKGFQVDLTDEDVRTLYYAVTMALEKWPGSPQRPADEQEKLFDMKDTLFRMILEINLEA